jgi:hypothetical protein
MKIKKNSYLKDSLFWYIVIITVFWFSMIFWGIAKADEILYSKVKTIKPNEVNGQYCMLKLRLNKRVIILLKKKFWSVLTVKKALKHQVIGSYLLNFIIETHQLQNIADTIVGQITSLKHQERRVLKINGEWEVK